MIFPHCKFWIVFHTQRIHKIPHHSLICFRTNPYHSGNIGLKLIPIHITKSVSEAFRIILNQSKIHFIYRFINKGKNQSDSSVRMNQNQSEPCFQSASSRARINSESFRTNQKTFCISFDEER